MVFQEFRVRLGSSELDWKPFHLNLIVNVIPKCFCSIFALFHIKNFLPQLHLLWDKKKCLFTPKFILFSNWWWNSNIFDKICNFENQFTRNDKRSFFRLITSTDNAGKTSWRSGFVLSSTISRTHVEVFFACSQIGTVLSPYFSCLFCRCLFCHFLSICC